MKSTCVLPFKTRQGGEYLLDCNTGVAMPINSLIDKAVRLYGKYDLEKTRETLLTEYPSELVEGALKFVQRWSTQYGGFYLNEKEKNVIQNTLENISSNDVRGFLEAGNMVQLVINLTEDCNLRCRYCYFSDAYKYTRGRTPAKLDPEKGIKALDYYFSLIRPIARRNPSKRVAITFYGGEPLLNFSTMRQLVEYAIQNSPAPLFFNFTTNGLLLTDEIVDFIVANDMNVAISLDGNKKDHDRNRVLPNNQGSHDIVLKNVMRFMERYPKYIKRSILCVYDWKTDLEANDRFFEQHKLPTVVFVNGVMTSNTQYYQQFSQEDYELFVSRQNRLINKYMEYKVQGKKMSDYLRVFVEGRLVPIIIRPRREDVKAPMTPYTGTCVPGFKINVRVDGTFDICERVNSTMPIGNLDTGLDYENIKEILMKYNQFLTSKCFYCPIKKSCSLCYSLCMGDGEFVKPENFCNRSLEGFSSSLSLVYSVLEEVPDAFSDIEGRFNDAILHYI